MYNFTRIVELTKNAIAVLNCSDIPELLLREGCFGRCGDICGCPVQKFINQFIRNTGTGTGIDVDVSSTTVNIWKKQYNREAINRQVILPLNVYHFILDFDTGRYPYLVGDSASI